MTETELRNQYINQIISWLGYSESNGKHKTIVDIYNSYKPLPQGYKLKYTDAWCAATVSAAAIKLGITDIMPPECSCPRMIEAYKKIGKWVENDGYTPKVGDLIMYDWDDTGSGDNTGTPEHVGAVVSVANGTIVVIEGNKNDIVAYRSMFVNGKYIRGYCTPDFASKAKTMKSTNSTEEDDEMRYSKISDIKSATYKEVVKKLISKGILNGKSGTGENTVIDLGEDALRLLVILDRAGVFDK